VKTHAFLLVGDAFLIEEKALSLTQLIQAQIQGDLHHQIFYLSDGTLENVLVEARTLPFLAGAQVFHLRDLEKIKKDDHPSLENYLARPFEKTFLFFETADIAKNDTLVKLIARSGEVCFLGKKEQKSSVSIFIRNKVKSAGKTITPRAMTLLEDAIGEMPSFLDSMLERLITFAGESAQIDERMVAVFEENWAEADIFQMINSLAERKTGRALSVLKEVLNQDEVDLVGILGALHWQIRRLWVASVLEAEGVPTGTILEKCRISERQVPFFNRQLRNFSQGQLERILEGLFQLDWQLKTGKVDGLIALESWILQACA